MFDIGNTPSVTSANVQIFTYQASTSSLTMIPISISSKYSLVCLWTLGSGGGGGGGRTRATGVAGGGGGGGAGSTPSVIIMPRIFLPDTIYLTLSRGGAGGGAGVAGTTGTQTVFTLAPANNTVGVLCASVGGPGGGLGAAGAGGAAGSGQIVGTNYGASVGKGNNTNAANGAAGSATTDGLNITMFNEATTHGGAGGAGINTDNVSHNGGSILGLGALTGLNVNGGVAGANGDIGLLASWKPFVSYSGGGGGSTNSGTGGNGGNGAYGSGGGGGGAGITGGTGGNGGDGLAMLLLW